MIEVTWVTLNPHHDFRIDARHLIGVHRQAELVRHIFLHPPKQILVTAADEKLDAHSVNAENPALYVRVKQALPESGAQIERLIQILRGDEDVGVDNVCCPIRRQESGMPSLLA